MLIKGTVILWIKRILYREPRINLLQLLVSLTIFKEIEDQKTFIVSHPFFI
jgi:hypothetical protein